MARKITIGLDKWTKKGLTASFLAVSACYFNSKDNKAEHTVTHTLLSLSLLLWKSVQNRGSQKKKKNLTIITDNGSNMVAAFLWNAEQDISSEGDNTQDSDEGY